MNRLAQWKANQTYKAKCNLLAHIHVAIEPQLVAMRRADDLLERTTRTSNGIESQGYSNLPGCSRLEICTFRPSRQLGDLTSENEPHGGQSLSRGMDKAESETRNVASQV